MWAAIRAVREPSYRSGAVCGAAIALAKTLAPESGHTPPRVPENVRRIFPAASVAQKTVRPEGGYAITLYRADAGAQLEASTVGESEALQPARDGKPGL
jgi:hypothetical protein